jgi:hypothetical protein
MSGQRVIALLGRPDAVEEYCFYLGEALMAEGFELIIDRIAWPESGWTRAAGASIGVVYQDIGTYKGNHVVDKLRRVAQLRTTQHDFAQRYS